MSNLKSLIGHYDLLGTHFHGSNVYLMNERTSLLLAQGLVHLLQGKAAAVYTPPAVLVVNKCFLLRHPRNPGEFYWCLSAAHCHDPTVCPLGQHPLLEVLADMHSDNQSTSSTSQSMTI